MASIRRAHSSRSSDDARGGERPARAAGGGLRWQRAGSTPWCLGLCHHAVLSLAVVVVITAVPLRHGNRRPPADLGGDLELVHQPPRAGQPQARARRRSVMPPRSAWSTSSMPGPASWATTVTPVPIPFGTIVIVTSPRRANRTMLRAISEIGGRDHRGLGLGEACLHGQLAAALSSHDDVGVVVHGDMDFVGARLRTPVEQGPADGGAEVTVEQVVPDVQLRLPASIPGRQRQQHRAALRSSAAPRASSSEYSTRSFARDRFSWAATAPGVDPSSSARRSSHAPSPRGRRARSRSLVDRRSSAARTASASSCWTWSLLGPPLRCGRRDGARGASPCRPRQWNARGCAPSRPRTGRSPDHRAAASRQQPNERLLDDVLRELGVLDVRADDAANNGPQIADPGRERVGEVTDVGAVVTSGHR